MAETRVDDADEEMGKEQEGAHDPTPGPAGQEWVTGGPGRMAKLLQTFRLRCQPDTMKEFAETFAEISSSQAASGRQSYQASLFVLNCQKCWCWYTISPPRSSRML